MTKRKRQMRQLLISVLFLLPALNQAGVGEGQVLYDAFCQICHGGIGEGQTMGKSLTDNSAKNLSDNDLIAVITDGRAGTGMAAWGSSLDTTEILDVAAYVRVLQGGTGLTSGEENTGVSDDPAVVAGELLFNGEAGCIDCHSYSDKGGAIGPDLDGLSSRLGNEQLLSALINPSDSIVDGYQTKTIELADGTTITGRYRNESDLAIQILSEDGSRWVTYFKDRVQSIEDATESLMPDTFTALNDEQQQQLLAFLRSL